MTTAKEKARSVLAGTGEPCSTVKPEPEHFHMHLTTDQCHVKHVDASHIGA